MRKENDIYKYMKGISTPKVENRSHQTFLKEKLKKEIEKTEYKKNYFEIKALRYSFSFALILIALSLGLFILHKNLQPIPEKGTLTSLKGDASIKQGDKYVKISKNIEVTKGDIIKTDKNSLLNVKIGENSDIKIDENTEIKIDTLQKKGKTNISKIYLNEGKIHCSVELPTKDSVFQICTDISTVSVKGTEFFVEVSDNKDIKVKVIKGTVEVSDLIKPISLLKDIKKADKNIFQSINNISNKKIFVRKETPLFIKNAEIKKLNNDLNSLIKKTHSSLHETGEIKDKKEIINNLNKLQIESKKIINEEVFTPQKKNNEPKKIETYTPKENDYKFQTFENASAFGWAWDKEDTVSLSEKNEPAFEGKHSMKLSIPKWPSRKGEGPFWRGCGIQSETGEWDININPGNENTKLVFWIYALPSNKTPNNLNIQFYDTNIHSTDETKVEYWTKEKANYNAWTKITIPFSELLKKAPDLDLQHINKIQIQQYWPGTYYIDNIISTK